MNDRLQVRTGQYFSVLYLSMLVGLFMYLSNVGTQIGSSDSLLQPFFFLVINGVATIPLWIYCTRNQDGILEKTKELSPALAKLFAVLYLLAYLYSAVRTTARFDLFVSSELFPETDMMFFIVTIVFLCALVSLWGLGTLSRGSVVFTILIVGATGFVILTVLDKIDPLNFTPFFLSGIPQFFRSGFSFSTFPIEIGAIVLFRKEISGNITRAYYVWLGVTVAMLLAISAIVVGTLGLFADSQLFPTYAIATLGEFGLFERLDALETAIWILCIIAKLTFLMVIVSKTASFLFPRVKRYWPPLAGGAVISAIIVAISGNIERFSFLTMHESLEIAYAVLVVVLPSAVLIYQSCKKHKGKRGEQV